jgi:hypothetical protein
MTTTTIPTNYLIKPSNRQYPEKGVKAERPYAAPLFVVWDGEGADIDKRHEYILLAAYDGQTFYEATDVEEGLSTRHCFALMLDVARHRPRCTHVVYGGSYDFNMILRDLPERHLRQLYETGHVRWLNYRIEYVPRRSLRISEGKTSIKIWDVLGFFQSSFVKAVTGWPVALTAEERKIIEAGKKKRGRFKGYQIEQITAYCEAELKVFLRLMKILDDMRVSFGLEFARWDGAGAAAQAYMNQNHVKSYMRREEIDYAGEWYTAVREAYAGGRIELNLPGDHEGTLYHNDLNAAYPSAIQYLPNLATGHYVLCNDPSCEIGDYDLAKVTYSGDPGSVLHPLGHRAYDGSICFPARVTAHRWGVEVNAVIETVGGINLAEHWHYVPGDDPQPFRKWIRDKYGERLSLKRVSDPRNIMPKLGLNSIYGKFAQQAGWKPGRKLPPWHQLEWAGMITAYTRAAVWRAIYDRTDDIVAMETDGVYSRVPLDVEVGEELGQWESEELSRLTYVQSGVYVADKAKDGTTYVRSRGIDLLDAKGKPVLTREKVLRAWETVDTKRVMRLPSTRFITLGLALAGNTISEDWRQWPRKYREISLLPLGKRRHSYDCHDHWGEGHFHRTIPIQPAEGSYPFAVKWVSEEEAYRHELMEAQLLEEREDSEALV